MKQAGLSAGPMVAVVVMVAATIAAYSSLAGNSFTRYDDGAYITANRNVMKGLSGNGIKWAFTEYHSGNWHPLTWISHMLDVSLFGMRAGMHHLVNLGLHVACALMLLAFLWHTTGRFWAGVFVAGLFALHPLHVESVAWAAERKDVLSTFFWFATMLAYAFYAKKPGLTGYLAVVALFALGLLSKPMLVTLPVVLLMLDYWPLQRREPKLSLVIEKLPLIGMAAASVIVTLKAQGQAIADLETLSIAQRLLNATASYGTYILQMFWPTNLSVFYPFNRSGLASRAALAALLLVVCSAAVAYRGKRYKYLVTGWLWYLVTLLPVIGIVQVGSQSHADRYTYVPLTGLFIIVAWLISDMVQDRRQLRIAMTTAGVAVLMLLGAMTYQQSGYWKNDLTLFGRAVAVTKDNAVALGNYGVALGEHGRVEEGLASLRKALTLASYDDLNLAAMGDILSQNERFAEALDCYARAIGINPSLKEAQLGMSTALFNLARPQEAEEYCRNALKLDAQWPQAWHQLGMILGQTGRTDEAISAFQRAAEDYPGMASARLNIAKLYAQKGRLDEAIEECRKSIAMEPYYAQFDYMGQLLASTDKPQEAEKAFREAVRMAPGVPIVHFHLAMILSQTGRHPEALEEARQATDLDPNDTALAQYYQQLMSEK